MGRNREDSAQMWQRDATCITVSTSNTNPSQSTQCRAGFTCPSGSMGSGSFGGPILSSNILKRPMHGLCMAICILMRFFCYTKSWLHRNARKRKPRRPTPAASGPASATNSKFDWFKICSSILSVLCHIFIHFPILVE